MQLFTLASGSTGNCSLLIDGDINVLIDAGISARRITTSLESLGVSVDDISAILITHEHSDHICGIKTLIKHHNINICAPRTVASHLCCSITGVEKFITILNPGEVASFHNLKITPFHTPHDTPESVGYRFDGTSTLGYCTDCGCVTKEVHEALMGVDAAVIEANHDIDMLRLGPYPPQLKRRVLSDHGHLSNSSCSELALDMYKNGTRQFILAHLSKENNIPKKAVDCVTKKFSENGISKNEVYIAVAPEKEILRIEITGGKAC